MNKAMKSKITIVALTFLAACGPKTDDSQNQEILKDSTEAAKIDSATAVLDSTTTSLEQRTQEVNAEIDQLLEEINNK